jgi:hypothetical protein
MSWMDKENNLIFEAYLQEGIPSDQFVTDLRGDSAEQANIDFRAMQASLNEHEGQKGRHFGEDPIQVLQLGIRQRLENVDDPQVDLDVVAYSQQMHKSIEQAFGIETAAAVFNPLKGFIDSVRG